MMRGPAYDDGYITRKMASYGPTFAPPAPGYGRPAMGGYMQKENEYDYHGWPYLPTNAFFTPTPRRVLPNYPLCYYSAQPDNQDRRSRSASPHVNRDSNKRSRTTGKEPPMSHTRGVLRELAAPITNEVVRDMNRAVTPPPRVQCKNKTYVPPTFGRYRFNSPTKEVLNTENYKLVVSKENQKEKEEVAMPPARAPRLAPPPPPTYYPEYDYGYGGYGGYGSYGGGYAPLPPAPRYSRYDAYLDDEYEVPYSNRFRHRAGEPLEVLDNEKPATDVAAPATGEAGDDMQVALRRPGRLARKSRVPDEVSAPLPESEGERHLARMNYRYPSNNESQALQEHVDKMRIKLKSLAYSLDPSGPVPDIVIPDRRAKTDDEKKYTPAVNYSELPKLSTRTKTPRYYPEDEYMKDNLRIRCLSQYKSTRTAAEYWKPKNFYGDEVGISMLPESYSSKSGKAALTKWEEPGTVYGSTSEKKPFSKPEGDAEDEARKERRKKKKSKEREELAAIESSVVAESDKPAESAALLTADTTSALADSSEGATDEMDEKERKRMEKKKRKAEREAAAKAAMEAELAALAEAEAELARLEAESAKLDAAQAKTAPIAAPEATSESAAEKSEEKAKEVAPVSETKPESEGQK